VIAFIIIWGNKWVFKPVPQGWAGTIHCPHCNVARTFTERQPVKYFTLYWMPLFPTSKGEPFIECTTCNHRYDKREDLEQLVPKQTVL